MRGHRPSFTAAAVSAARGLAGLDALSMTLTDGPLGTLARLGFGGTPEERKRAFGAVNLATLGLVDHLALRTRVLDEEVRAATRAGHRGAEQLVVLGAGLDARAWRMSELAGTTVFEVDHPSTQAFKRARIGERSPVARSVRFVEVDFAHDDLEAKLREAGHQASKPTFWLWEGVIPYLPRQALRATLRIVAARSAPGSTLAATYAIPGQAGSGRRLLQAVGVAFRAFGEPLVGLLSRVEMHEELRAVGFEVESDTRPREWAARVQAPGFALDHLRGRVVPERCVIAHRARAS